MIWIAVLIALLALAALALPVELRLSARLDTLGGPLRKQARLRWAFGPVHVDLGGHRPGAKQLPGRWVAKMPSRLDLRRLLLDPAFWLRLGSLLTRLLGTIQWRLLRFHAKVGLDDPADTGRLSGLITSTLLPISPAGYNVTMEPVFEGPALAFHGEARLRLVPLRLLWVFASFAAAPATWRVLRSALRR